MNYKVILTWLLAGFLAYTAGIKTNVGTVVACSVIGFALFCIGFQYIKFPEETKWEPEEPVMGTDDEPLLPSVPYMAPQDLSVLSPKPKLKKKGNYVYSNPHRKFWKKDKVRFVSADTISEERHLNETFTLIERNTPLTWQMVNDKGEMIFAFDTQIEMVSRPKQVRGMRKKRYTITVEGMSLKQRQMIYQARHHAKKLLKENASASA